uniref:Small ribosomal subunit protein uS8c n=1 Tax=Euglenaformis proxima TaxID=299110 RepID=A0A023HHR9_9EUGL|nr:ribosomal protein S8 [Euglenaformis proxima]AGL12011.1 ribosomal protein S8 [Euglenaformis proxima]
MNNIDFFSDMLTRMRNANLVKSKSVKIINTKINYSVLTILKQEGFIENFKTIVDESKKVYISIGLKYKGPKVKPYITFLKIISKPGLRVYVNYKNIPKILGGIGIAILSTSSGLMTDREARRKKIGGELLLYIY